MSTSLIYRSSVSYELLMRVLYGRDYDDRMRAVAEQVPEGASVLELCCGPGTLYLRYLRGRVSGYAGIDVNPRFVEQLNRRGVAANRLDLSAGDERLPAADVAILQASLYHFLPEAQRIVDRTVQRGKPCRPDGALSGTGAAVGSDSGRTRAGVRALGAS